jgi:hypothetical protein
MKKHEGQSREEGDRAVVPFLGVAPIAKQMGIYWG